MKIIYRASKIPIYFLTVAEETPISRARELYDNGEPILPFNN